jgi:hypothetical protein
VSTQQFRSYNFRATQRKLIGNMIEIIDEMSMTMTARQLYYQFIGRDLFPDSWVDDVYNAKKGLRSPRRKSTRTRWSVRARRSNKIMTKRFVVSFVVEAEHADDLNNDHAIEAVEEAVTEFVDTYRVGNMKFGKVKLTDFVNFCADLE